MISANLDGVDRIISKAAVGVFHVKDQAEFSRDFLAGSTELVAENSHPHTVEFGKTLSVGSPNGTTSNENYMEFRYGMLEGECCKSLGDEKNNKSSSENQTSIHIQRKSCVMKNKQKCGREDQGDT